MHAALAAAQHGCDMALVSDGPPGGRATWKTLLPSKMWLDARPPVALPALRARWERVAGAWQRQLLDDLERAGVELRLGTGSFSGPNVIQVIPPEGGYPDGINADAVILATGSVPFFPPGLDQRSAPYFQ